MADAKTTFGNRLRVLRQLKGHTRARHAALALGISENSYTRYERGQSQPSLELLYKIMQSFEITPNELFGYEPVEAAMEPPGFGEAPAPRLISRTEANERHDGVEGVAWRLAREFAKARTADTAQGEPLGELPLASEIFIELEREPIRTIARLLADPHVARLPRTVQARIRVDVDRLLAAAEGKPRP